MLFSSLEFLFLFLPLSLLCYYFVPLNIRNLVLLLFSLVFYGWGEPRYVFLMIFTILVDYFFGLLINKQRNDGKNPKLMLTLCIVVNLLILGFFKYYDFIANNLRLIPMFSFLPTLNLELPVGISFYTFQALSYVIDVYRYDADVQKNPINFGAYVTLFPQLIAGPIVRYKDVDAQLNKRSHNLIDFSSGINTFICGLAKKVLLANPCGALCDAMTALPSDMQTVFGSFMGIIFFSFQIYFDFSGYSDMAIGLGKMFGFKFLENFNYPYISKSISEFWRRWHISLGTWFREYVYIPLGGNRVGKFRLFRNLFAVWFLTGLWHGASWNFILWGVYYFVLLALEKVFLGKILDKLPSFVSRIYSLFFILIGWAIFYFEDLSLGLGYISGMFGFGSLPLIDTGNVYDLTRNLVFIVILVIASTPLPKKIYTKLSESQGWFKYVSGVISLVIFTVCVAYLVSSNYNPFLYFRF